MPISAKRLSKVLSSFSRDPSSNGSASPVASSDTSAGMAPVVEPAAPESDKKLKIEEEVKVAKAEKPLPTFDELPMFKNMPGCAWSVWGEKDQLGTVNILTEEVVARAAKEEMKCELKFLFSRRELLNIRLYRLGKCVSLNWSVLFFRKSSSMMYLRSTIVISM